MKYTKTQLIENIKVSLTDLLNQYVEETSFDENNILDIIKQEAKKMKY